jgi:hypothetical protein
MFFFFITHDKYHQIIDNQEYCRLFLRHKVLAPQGLVQPN